MCGSLTRAGWSLLLWHFLCCRFLYDGERINEDDTPQSLEMEDNGTHCVAFFGLFAAYTLVLPTQTRSMLWLNVSLVVFVLLLMLHTNISSYHFLLRGRRHSIVPEASRLSSIPPLLIVAAFLVLSCVPPSSFVRLFVFDQIQRYQTSTLLYS